MVELVGSGDIVAPEQKGPTCTKFGRMDWLIAILIVCVVAQSPAVGEKVYVVVAELFIAGDQVPEIPLFELVGNALIVVPEQKGPTCVKVGVVF